MATVQCLSQSQKCREGESCCKGIFRNGVRHFFEFSLVHDLAAIFSRQISNFGTVISCKQRYWAVEVSSRVDNLMSRQKFTLRLFSVLAVSGCLAAGFATIAQAQGLPGFTIFSGVERENQLSWRMDYDGRPGSRDRYRLRIPSKKMEFAVEQFSITYPDTYRGEFDPDSVEIKVDGDEVVIDEVTWDSENRVIEIYPQQPVPADTRVELVLSDVRNPNRVGTHYFTALVRSPGDLPMMRYLGTWILSIGNR